MKIRRYMLFRVVALALACLAIAAVTINKTASIHAAPMLAGPPLSFAGTGFPDADPFSGRFITVSRGTGSLGNVGTTQTLLNIELQIPDAQPNFKLAIFDGDMGGHWDETDSGADQLTYMVFEDPDRNGMKTAGQLPIASYPSTSMTDDGWFETTVAQTAAADNPDGFHYYHLVAEWNTLNVIDEANYFKVVVQGTPFLLAGSTIGFIGHPGGTIEGVVHPITTFNGTFSFFLSNSNASSTFVDIFDGDLDLSTDGIDANSPALPPFQTSPLTDNEGAHPGNPSNPGISYTLTAPAVPGGNWSRTNSNPSGNQEWELFRIRTDGSPTPLASADITLNPGETIPQGLYQLQVFNVIVANNIFFHADFDLFAEQPCTRTIGDFVWNDQNGDGDFDAGEPGIPGVTVELRDAPTCAGPFPAATLATTTTDGSGAYQFSNLSKGCYQVKVVENGPLTGFTKTTGPAPNANNNSQSNPYLVDLTGEACVNNLTADFGYQQSSTCPVCTGQEVLVDTAIKLDAANLAATAGVLAPFTTFDGSTITIDLKDRPLHVTSTGSISVLAGANVQPPQFHQSGNHGTPNLTIKSTCSLLIDDSTRGMVNALFRSITGVIETNALGGKAGDILLDFGGAILINGGVQSFQEKLPDNAASTSGAITIKSLCGEIRVGPKGWVVTWGENPGTKPITFIQQGTQDIVINGLVMNRTNHTLGNNAPPTINLWAQGGKVIIDGSNLILDEFNLMGTKYDLTSGLLTISREAKDVGKINIQASGDVSVFRVVTLGNLNRTSFAAVATVVNSASPIGGTIRVRSLTGKITARDRAFQADGRGDNSKALIELVAKGDIVALTPAVLNVAHTPTLTTAAEAVNGVGKGGTILLVSCVGQVSANNGALVTAFGSSVQGSIGRTGPAVFAPGTVIGNVLGVGNCVVPGSLF